MKTSSRLVGSIAAIIAIEICLAPGCVPLEREPIPINVLTIDQTGPSPEGFDAIVGEYNRAHPEVQVQMDYVPYKALHDRIVSAAEQEPVGYDAVFVDSIWYAEFVQAGYLWDVTDRITAEMRTNIFKPAWDITTNDERIFGMPWLVDQKYFYINDRLFKQAGFTLPPATWEEVVEQARTIQGLGLAQYPIAWSWAQAEAMICDLAILIYGNGGRFLNEQGQPAFNEAQGVEALTWMVSILQSGLSDPASLDYLEEDVLNTFSQGNVVFATNWYDMYDRANSEGSDSQVIGQVKLSLMPVFAAQNRLGLESATVNGSAGISVLERSSHREETWAFVQYLTSENNQIVHAGRTLPIWQSSIEGTNLKDFVKLNPSAESTLPIYREQLSYARLRPQLPYYAAASAALQQEVHAALVGEKSPQAALDDAAARWMELAAP